MTIPLELTDKIARLGNLPTLPRIATLIMNRINAPQTSAKDIASIAGQDVSLSAKILRLSNSAFYGMPRKVSNLHDAIVILGFKVIHTVVITQTVFDLFPDRSISVQFNRKAFWKHSITCGLLSKLMAGMAGFKTADPEDCFCAGLLHDIGRIVMEQYLHEDLHNAIDYSLKSGKSLFQSESDLLGYTHLDVAELLISGWNLPAALHYPIIFHHYPARILQEASAGKALQPFHALACLCHFSDYLCYDEIIQCAQKGLAPPPLDPVCLQSIGLDEGGIAALKNNLVRELEKIEVFYNILSP